MNSIFLQIKNLTKRYKEIEALKGVSFDIKKGEIFSHAEVFGEI